MRTLKALPSYKKPRGELGTVKKQFVDASFPLFVVGQGACVEHPCDYSESVVESDTELHAA